MYFFKSVIVSNLALLHGPKSVIEPMPGYYTEDCTNL